MATDSRLAGEAAARLVDAKHMMDQDRHRIGKPAIWPSAFIEYTFPFADGGRGVATDRVEYVPAELIIDARWNESWDDPPTGSDAEILCDRLDQLARDRSVPDWAILVRVGTLPLWYAVEGKNRVAMYRALGRPLLAEVRTTRHPDPHSLVVRGGDGIAGVTHVESPTTVSPLPLPDAAVLLVAAGAATGPSICEQDSRRWDQRIQKRAAFLETPW